MNVRVAHLSMLLDAGPTGTEQCRDLSGLTLCTFIRTFIVNLHESILLIDLFIHHRWFNIQISHRPHEIWMKVETVPNKFNVSITHCLFVVINYLRRTTTFSRVNSALKNYFTDLGNCLKTFFFLNFDRRYTYCIYLITYSVIFSIRFLKNVKKKQLSYSFKMSPILI